MNKNYSQSITDDSFIEKVNNIKDQLLTKSWKEVKNNHEIVTQALSNFSHINAGVMIDMERVNLLSKIFSKHSVIHLKDMNQILKVIADSTESGPTQEALDAIVPGLKVNDNINWTEYKQYASQLLNGYNNLKHIALLMIAEDLYIDIQVLNRLSPEQINSMTEKIKLLSQQIIVTLNSTGDLSEEQFEETCKLLKLTGRTNFEIVRIINNRDRFAIVDLFVRVKQASEVVQYAQKDNLVNQLSDVNTVAQILEKIKSK